MPKLRTMPNPSIFSLFSLLLALCAAVAGGVLPVRAQTEVTGAIRGQVFDTQRGTPLAGVIVQIINEDTEVPTPAKTDANGNFSKQGLPAGNYYIRVNTAGYAPFELKQRIRIMNTDDIKPLPIPLQSLTAANNPPVNPTMTPDPTTPGTPPVAPTASPNPNQVLGTVETIASTESINTTDARLAGSFGKEKLKTLPVGSTSLTRSFDEFALLLPGVALPPQTSGGIAGPGVGPGVGSSGQFAVNGLRSRGNNFTVDGSDNNDEDIGVRRQGFFALVPQSIESVEEYQVTTALLPAQYGRNFGAFVNAVSRSGSRKFHGDVYGFFNSSQLNARNFFDTNNGNARTPLTAGTNQPVLLDGRQINTLNESGGEDSFTLGQGGFTFGGPLTRARASGRGVFFFLSGEKQVLNASRELSFAVPTVEERGTLGSGASGLFFNPLTCGNFNNLSTCTGGAADFYFPTSLQGDAVFSLFPFANNPSGVYGRNTLTQVLPANARGLILSARSDADFTAFGVTHRLTGRYNYTDDKRDIPSVGGAIFSALRPLVRTNNFALALNSQISDQTTNELRASYGRTRLNFTDINQTPQGRAELRRSNKLPGTAFLLNAPYLINNTLPQCSLGGGLGSCFSRGGRIVANTGPVLFNTGTTVETGGNIGPLGQVVVAGYSPIGVDVFSFPQTRVNNTYQLADTLSFTRGTHRLTFGGDFRRAELNSDLPRNSRTLLTFYGAPRLRVTNSSSGPVFRFDGFYRPSDLAAAQAASGTFQTLAAPGASSNIGLRYYQNYLFGQDEWRVTERLSVSYGLRYEYTTPPREVNGIIENTFSNPLISSLVPGLNNFIAGRSRLFDPDRNNFAPRLGVAYSLRPTTVIRAGFGRYFDQIIGAVVSQSRNTFPSFLTLNSSGGLGGITGGSFGIFNFANPNSGICIVQSGACLPGTFRSYTTAGTLNGVNPALREINGQDPVATIVNVNNREFAGGFGATLPARDLSSPEAYHYGVTVEQQLASDIIFSLGYVGTQGRHLLRFTTPNLGANVILLPLTFNQNAIVPDFGGFAFAPGTRISSSGIVTGGRPVSTVGAVNIFESSANSRYNGVQAQVRGRLAQRLQFQVAYTLSEVKDDVSDVFDLAGASSLPQNSLTRAGEYAPANFDAHHRLTYNFVYDMPSGSNRSRAYRAVFGGLQIAGTGFFQTGQPFTVNSIFDVNLDGNLTDRLNSLGSIEQTGNRRQPLRVNGDTTNLLAPVGQDGSVERNSFRAGNVLDLNLSAIKSFFITETQRIVVRVDVFNFINRKNYGIPVRFLEAPGFGQATETVTPGRRIQFSLRYSF